MPEVRTKKKNQIPTLSIIDFLKQLNKMRKINQYENDWKNYESWNKKKKQKMDTKLQEYGVCGMNPNLISDLLFQENM